MNMKACVVFNCLTQREVDFYLATAKSLRSDGVDCIFISFFQPGNKKISSEGFKCYDFYKFLNTGASLFPYENLNIDDLISHECVTFGLSRAVLKKKMIIYLNACLNIFNTLSENENRKYFVVQELGGFISSLSIFYVSKYKSIPHYFMEPSFYKGRIHAVPNSIYALSPQSSQIKNVEEVEVSSYLKNLKSSQRVAIPIKDRHHFMDMNLAKIFNRSNLFKIFKKLSDKFVKKYKFEFNHIGFHVYRYIQMYVRRKFRGNLYSKWTPEIQNKKYIYVPLHVELDYSLTIRSPSYFDQLKNIEELLKEIPSELFLYTKEHPASIGGFSNQTLRRLLSSYSNFKLIHPSINSFEIIKNSQAIVTINSKIGMEALAFDKPVIVLGDAVYSYCSEVFKAKSIKDAANFLKQPSFYNWSPNPQGLNTFFTSLYAESFPTELYDLSEENIKYFGSALKDRAKITDQL